MRFLCLIILSLSLLIHTAQAQRSDRKLSRPNVILIVAENLGFGDLGAYGQTHFQTPRIDQFAKQGLRFTNYYAGSSIGVASRGTIMTGKHTGSARIRGDKNLSLASMDQTLGELAKQAGYHTAAIGKWGLGDAGSEGIPTVKGFDEWFGYLTESSANTHYPTTLWRNQTNLFWSGNTHGKQDTFAPYLFTQASTNFVHLNQRKPFFLYLAYALPAPPLESPTDKPYKNETWPKPQKTLAAMMYRLDREIGRIVDSLKQLKLDEKTVVLFTSSGGPKATEGIDPSFFNSTGNHRRQGGALYEGSIRVPLIVRWPGTVDAGKTSAHICAAWDLYPTIANLMGISEFDTGDGISLTPTLVGRRQTKHSYLYWETHEGENFAQAARSGDWKAVRSGPGQATELYRLDRDPTETKNLAGRYRRTTRRMERILNEARTPSSDWPSPLDP